MLEDRLIQVENGIRQCRMMLDDLDAVTHEPIWVLRSSFPTKLVEDLFEEKGLRDLRKQRRNMPLPQGHELIDSLF